MKQQVAIKGMTCGGCAKTVEKALSQIEGVKAVSVSLSPPQAVIQADSAISMAQLQAVLSKAGNYSIEGTQAANEQKKSGGGCCG
ncbi:heavy-metal-associated domain-containing protein [Aequorivita sp. CIP111184]|uniref:heavy-metal-associated domain-containing protein n=1 Tax=Aequorivita sp. CIP111184 TaxID=2211356 RepID=UPI000DBC319F|nr:heavy metal-associated domain-containing protein [Aequorivita sp. CIP111184]SRX55089.1 Lead, cadmium, zinc and mercury-transporting ATPase [Aequorivita sp. CIP111184]